MAHPQNSARGLFVKKALSLNSTSSFSANSTGLIIGGALFINSQTTRGKISANSTALTLPNVMKITGAHANATITANSTGIKIGTKYITTNSTGTTL
jgi:hypothetical protein